MGWTFEETWFEVGQGQQISLNRPNLFWAPLTPIHWVSRFFLRQPGHEAVHSPSSGTDAKNEWWRASTTPPPTKCFNGVHRDNFSVTFTENILMIRAIVRVWRMLSLLGHYLKETHPFFLGHHVTGFEEPEDLYTYTTLTVGTHAHVSHSKKQI